MPSNIVKSFAKKSGKSEEEVEKIWKKLKNEYGEDYEAITGTLKKMLGLNEGLNLPNFKEYLKENDVRTCPECGATSGFRMERCKDGNTTCGCGYKARHGMFWEQK